MVIAAVDGSEHSLKALEWARAAAVRHGTGLVVAHVLSDSVQLYAARRSSLQDRGEPEEAEDPVSVRIRAHLATGGELPAEVRYASLEGSVPEALRDIGEGARMLVMGSRGRGGFAALLLGSNSRAVATSAGCPVVVVAHEARGVDAASQASAGRVVLGLHAAETPDNVLDFAFTEAAARGTTLQVVSAYSIPPSPTMVIDSPFAVIPPEALVGRTRTRCRPSGRCSAPRRSGSHRSGRGTRPCPSSRPRCPGTRPGASSPPRTRRRWSSWAATTRAGTSGP